MRVFRTFFPKRSSASQEVFVSCHHLDLKRQQGFLKGRYLDLPQQDPPDQLYLRRNERWIIPASYRTGMAFFATVLIVSLSSIQFFGAAGQADSRQSFLSAQLLGNIEHTSQQQAPLLPKHSETNTLAFFPETDEPLSPDLLENLLDTQKSNDHETLVKINRSLQEGFKAFDSFLEYWQKLIDNPLLSQLAWMHSAGKKAINAWGTTLSTAARMEFDQLQETDRLALLESLGVVQHLSSALNSYDQSYEHIVKALGKDEPQRILVFIQDSYQQRAAGGALSAAVELLLENGEVLAWRPFHAEEYDDLLRVDLLPPVSMRNFTERWDLQTANAFVDAEQSAEQIHWFWQREARSSADLILLISSEALERVLSHEATSDIFDEETRSQIESFALRWSSLAAVNDREGLKALGNLALHAFRELLLHPSVMIQLHPLLKEQLMNQQVLVYSSSPEQQALFREEQVAGSFPRLEEKEDFLMINTLNQTEEMTDRWREDHYTLHTSLETDGSIKHWLHLYRQQSNNARYYADDLDPVFIRNMRGQTHRSVVQVVVPRGSKLLGVDGLSLSEIQTSDSDRFQTWSFSWEVGSGRFEEVAISYELPWSFDTTTVDNYRLHLIKQPGAKAVGFEHQLKLPAELTLFQQLPTNPIQTLDRNEVIAVVAGKNP